MSSSTTSITLTPFNEWPTRVTVHEFQSMSGPRRRYTDAVGYRTCPHGIEHFDPRISGQVAQNAWMVTNSCTNEHCKQEVRDTRE